VVAKRLLMLQMRNTGVAVKTGVALMLQMRYSDVVPKRLLTLQMRHSGVVAKRLLTLQMRYSGVRYYLVVINQ